MKKSVRKMTGLLAVVLAVTAAGCGRKEIRGLGTGYVHDASIEGNGGGWDHALPGMKDELPGSGRVIAEAGRVFAEAAGSLAESAGASAGWGAGHGDRAASAMGSVPYFRDDAGKNTQTVDGWLYGYWNNRLCRYDPETLEETVLYEAASPQRGDFCIWGDYVYFMEVPGVSALGKRQGNLYRVRCDGSGEAVLLTSVDMPGQSVTDGRVDNYFRYYYLDTYEDILYLIQQYDDEENLYFHLDRDGGITPAGEDETLYGRLPEGDFSRWDNHSYGQAPFMTLPYAMRNYGYVFMEVGTGRPVRIDLESRQVENINIPKDYAVREVTNDAVIVSKTDTTSAGHVNHVWCRVSLDDTEKIQEIGVYPADSCIVTDWGRSGVSYAAIFEDGHGRLRFMDWEGKDTAQPYGLYVRQTSPVAYFDGNYFYYVSERQGNNMVRRMPLTGDEETKAEDVALYSVNPGWEITDRECTNYEWTDTHTGAKVDYSMTRILFKEDKGALGKINDFLEELYARDMAVMEEYREAVKENSESDHPDILEEWGGDYVELSDSYQVVWLDEDYVGIALYWYQYWKGAAHGQHGTIYYTFDRHTGNRVSVTDVTGKTPEEVCGIIAPYVEVIAMWGTDEEGWEAGLLEEERFFLSEEGIGIHFDPYEINGYAQGEQEIIVPYGAFD